MRSNRFTENSQLSRRRFLELATAAAGGSLLPSRATAGTPSRLRMPPGREPSRVIQIQSSQVIQGRTVHRQLVQEMLDRSLQSLTGQTSTRSAWRSILHPDDVVGLKFNRSGQQIIGTSKVLGSALISTLIEAGWPASQIVCIEVPAAFEKQHATTAAIPGYRPEPSDFGSGRDQLALVVDQVSAIINIPFLKTHNIAGMTCALKNLSHGLVKHPARYHSNGCSPFIADIVGDTPIGEKLRLCIVDALRVVYSGGPEATAEATFNEGAMIVSTDPVAAKHGAPVQRRAVAAKPPPPWPATILWATTSPRCGLPMTAASAP